MTQLKTLAIKARLANHIRKIFFKRTWDSLKVDEKDQILLEIFSQNSLMHSELNAYKAKRRAKRELLKKRKAAPQTKTMMKKLGPKRKGTKINLVVPK